MFLTQVDFKTPNDFQYHKQEKNFCSNGNTISNSHSQNNGRFELLLPQTETLMVCGLKLLKRLSSSLPLIIVHVTVGICD